MLKVVHSTASIGFPAGIVGDPGRVSKRRSGYHQGGHRAEPPTEMMDHWFVLYFGELNRLTVASLWEGKAFAK